MVEEQMFEQLKTRRYLHASTIPQVDGSADEDEDEDEDEETDIKETLIKEVTVSASSSPDQGP